MTGRSPVASIVIPVYRGWSLTQRLLESLEATFVPGEPLEIIVVDDGSGDGGGASLSAVVGGEPLHLLTRTENGGFAAAVNTGLRVSSAPVCVVLNNDIVISVPEILHLARTVAHSNVVVAPMLLDRGRLLHPGRRELSGRHDLAEYCLLSRLLPGPVQARARGHLRPSTRRQPDWVVGACLAFQRDLWLQVGPFDERFHMNSEEVDWQRRARGLGARVVVLPHVIAQHDSGQAEDGPEVLERRLFWGWSSRLQYVRKWEGPDQAQHLLRRLGQANAVNGLLLLLLRAARVLPQLQRRLEVHAAVHERLGA